MPTCGGRRRMHCKGGGERRQGFVEPKATPPRARAPEPGRRDPSAQATTTRTRPSCASTECRAAAPPRCKGGEQQAGGGLKPVRKQPDTQLAHLRVPIFAIAFFARAGLAGRPFVTPAATAEEPRERQSNHQRGRKRNPRVAFDGDAARSSARWCHCRCDCRGLSPAECRAFFLCGPSPRRVRQRRA